MLFVVFALCATVSAVAPAPRIESPSVVIRADKVLLGDGRVLEKAVVVIERGKISEVGASVEPPAGMPVIEHKGTLSAGMIALRAYVGASDSFDVARPAMPDASIALGIDATRPELKNVREAGITTILVAPSPRGITSGTTAVFKTAGRSVLSDAAQLSLIFSASGLSFNKEPTSYGGQMAKLEELFESKSENVAKAKSKKLPCLFEVDSRADVQRALGFAKRHGLTGILCGAEWAGELAADIKEAKFSVIQPVIEVGADKRELAAVLALAKEGVPFGFAVDAPLNHASHLRASAVMCLRAGLDAKTAWNALTSEAARIAGVQARVGRIERGLDADLVLWSGDPLDLASSVQAVYIDGERVFGAEQ